MKVMTKKKLGKVLMDPPVRKSCVVCGGPKEEPKVGMKGFVYRTDLDPFCSTKCCRKYYDSDENTANQPMSRDM